MGAYIGAATPGVGMSGKSHLQLEQALSASKCGLGPTRAGLTGHDVHFYRTDAHLVQAVVSFLSDGLRIGQPILIIATEPHRNAFAEGLRAKGVDPDQLLSGRVAVWLDARETLSAFMEGSMPNRELFRATVGRVFERLLDRRFYLIVRAYGEMVDLLWKDGNAQGAIKLEQFWNELADEHKYSLLCGYSLDNFLHPAGAEGFRRVCEHHTHALPLEPAREIVA
jgi:hypothetical protein